MRRVKNITLFRRVGSGYRGVGREGGEWDPVERWVCLSLPVCRVASVGVFVATLACSAAACASDIQVLMSFGNMKGTIPTATPIMDRAGNLYVAGTLGGANDDGVVVELSPPTVGRKGWTKTVLHTFDGADGEYADTGLILDAAGNLYGGTEAAGPKDAGVIYKLSPPLPGQTVWKETTVYAFSGPDGYVPQASLIADGAGNFYGTTNDGGPENLGVVFELSPPPQGQKTWIETVLYTFSGPDGANPAARLMADSAGNLYGTAAEGGASNDGLVFELSPPPQGQKAWTETVLHTFGGADGQYPVSPLIADGAGDLYGTTGSGGAYGDGVVFKLSPAKPGKTNWTATVLRSFNGKDGRGVAGGVVADRAGNLYGMAAYGGANDDGVVFKLSPPLAGHTAWTETTLRSFDGKNGKTPYVGLMADGAGAFYGTTEFGGQHDDGVVFKFTP
jgi:uncharacterized repeat protein (TIGR03803 family)